VTTESKKIFTASVPYTQIKERRWPLIQRALLQIQTSFGELLDVRKLTVEIQPERYELVLLYDNRDRISKLQFMFGGICQKPEMPKRISMGILSHIETKISDFEMKTATGYWWKLIQKSLRTLQEINCNYLDANKINIDQKNNGDLIFHYNPI
jgi:hypothetical protein